MKFVQAGLQKRRGVRASTRERHEGELLYRFEKAGRLGAAFGENYYRLIVRLIRITGPLNRPSTFEANFRGFIYNIDHNDNLHTAEWHRRKAASARALHGYPRIKYNFEDEDNETTDTPG